MSLRRCLRTALGAAGLGLLGSCAALLHREGDVHLDPPREFPGAVLLTWTGSPGEGARILYGEGRNPPRDAIQPDAIGQGWAVFEGLRPGTYTFALEPRDHEEGEPIPTTAPAPLGKVPLEVDFDARSLRLGGELSPQPVLLALPRAWWAATSSTDPKRRHQALELHEVAHCCLREMFGIEVYTAGPDELESLQQVRRALVDTDAELRFGLQAPVLITLDLRLPDGDGPAQLELRAFDLVVPHADENALERSWAGAPLVFQDFQEMPRYNLPHEAGPLRENNNTEALIAAMGELLRGLRADPVWRQYTEALAGGFTAEGAEAVQVALGLGGEATTERFLALAFGTNAARARAAMGTGDPGIAAAPPAASEAVEAAAEVEQDADASDEAGAEEADIPEDAAEPEVPEGDPPGGSDG